MKRILVSVRKQMIGLALVGLLLLPAFTTKTLATPLVTSSNTLHLRNAEKRLDITVEIHGKIDGYSAQSVEAIVQPWLEAAHVAVVNADGVDILELHIRIDKDDDDDDDDEDDDGNGDGKGWHIRSECGEWDEDHDADSLEAINGILHVMVNHFIEKFVK